MLKTIRLTTLRSGSISVYKKDLREVLVMEGSVVKLSPADFMDTIADYCPFEETANMLIFHAEDRETLLDNLRWQFGMEGASWYSQYHFGNSDGKWKFSEVTFQNLNAPSTKREPIGPMFS